MKTFVLQVNGQPREVSGLAPDTPLLWVLRDTLGLTGTKYGCGIDQCGVCTVHIDGRAVRSCTYPLEQAEGKSIVTIEGLAGADGTLHPVQQAWIDHDVAQCGYCQPGQIMQASALLMKNPEATQEELERGMDGNLCRCGTYQRIRTALAAAAEQMKGARV